MWAFEQIDAGRGADLLIVFLDHTNLVLLVSISHKHKVHWIPQFFLIYIICTKYHYRQQNQNLRK